MNEYVAGIYVPMAVVVIFFSIFSAAPSKIDFRTQNLDDMNTKKLCRDLTDEEAINLHGFLSAQYENQKMKYGAFSRGATKWNVSERTVRRLWKSTTERAPGVTVLEAIRKKYKSKCGRKPLSKELISSKLKKVPLVRRSTLRSCAFATGFSKLALHRALKRDVVVKCRN